MDTPQQSPEAIAFAKYLETRKILIADPSAAARSGLMKVFAELGAKPAQITLANTFKQASDQINEQKPHIVCAEYELGKRCGLDLLQSQREQRPKETKETLFVVVTANTSQSAVARAAEENIDAYVLKPFTPEIVRRTLLKAAIAKIRPSDYVLAIEEGKKALDENKVADAEAKFKTAMELDPSPSLACYYLGQTRYMGKVLDEAKGNYNKGLNFNKIHYKCLAGLYELLLQQKNHRDAYEVVKRICQYFPANPKRLAEVLRLAIINAKYEDVEKYYAVFCNIEDRDDNLINYICAALVVCGKYYLGQKLRTRAMELFQKAATTGTGRVKILKEIVQSLIDFALIKDAQGYLDKFPKPEQNSNDYKILAFQILDLEGKRSVVIEKGRELIAAGAEDARVYRIMIQRSMESKLTSAAEALFQDAVKKYPDRKAEFEAMVKALHVKK